MRELALTRDSEIGKLDCAQVTAESSRLLSEVVCQQLVVHAGEEGVYAEFSVEGLLDSLVLVALLFLGLLRLLSGDLILRLSLFRSRHLESLTMCCNAVDKVRVYVVL